MEGSKLIEKAEQHTTSLHNLYQSYIEKLESELKEAKEKKQEYQQKYYTIKRKKSDAELAEENKSLKRELGKYKYYEKSAPGRTKTIYYAYITYAGRQIEVGQYNTIEEANKAQKRASKALA